MFTPSQPTFPPMPTDPTGPEGETWERLHEIPVKVICSKCGQPAWLLDFVDMDEDKYDPGMIPHRPVAWVVQPHGDCGAFEVEYGQLVKGQVDADGKFVSYSVPIAHPMEITKEKII